MKLFFKDGFVIAEHMDAQVKMEPGSYTYYSAQTDRFSLINRMISELPEIEQQGLFESLAKAWGSRFIILTDPEPYVNSVRQYTSYLTLEYVQRKIYAYIDDGFFKIPNTISSSYQDDSSGITSRSKTYILSEMVDLVALIIHLQPLCPAMIFIASNIYKVTAGNKGYQKTFDETSTALGWNKNPIADGAMHKLDQYYRAICGTGPSAESVIRSMQPPTMITRGVISKLLIRQLQVIDYSDQTKSAGLIGLLWTQINTAFNGDGSKGFIHKKMMDLADGDTQLAETYRIIHTDNHDAVAYSVVYLKSLRWVEPFIKSLRDKGYHPPDFTTNTAEEWYSRQLILKERLMVPMQKHVNLLIDILLGRMLLAPSEDIDRETIIKTSIVLNEVLKNSHVAIANLLLARTNGETSIGVGTVSETNQNRMALVMKNWNAPIDLILDDLNYVYGSKWNDLKTATFRLTYVSLTQGHALKLNDFI